MFQKRSRLKKYSPFQGFAKLRTGRLVRQWKTLNRLFRSCCCFLARKVSQGKIAFDAGNLAEVSPILEELSSALIPLAQHIADELMREDAGLNEKNHGLIFHANIRSRPTSPLTTVGKIPSKSSQEKFSLIVDFLGIPGPQVPSFYYPPLRIWAACFFFADFFEQKWKRFGGVRKSGSRTLQNNSLEYSCLGGGFKYFSCSSLFWGNDPIWRAYLSDGLVQPPTSCFWHLLTHGMPVTCIHIGGDQFLTFGLSLVNHHG